MNNRSISLGWLVVWVSLVSVILAGATLFLEQQPRYESFEFTGTILEVDGSVITLRGNYVVPEWLDAMRPWAQQTVRVRITSETELIKTIVHLPTAEELVETGGKYFVADLPREDVVGSYQDILELQQSGGGFEVRSSNNIFNDRYFDAEVIQYYQGVRERP